MALDRVGGILHLAPCTFGTIACSILDEFVYHSFALGFFHFYYMMSVYFFSQHRDGSALMLGHRIALFAARPEGMHILLTSAIACFFASFSQPP